MPDARRTSAILNAVASYDGRLFEREVRRASLGHHRQCPPINVTLEEARLVFRLGNDTVKACVKDCLGLGIVDFPKPVFSVGDGVKAALKNALR